MPPVQISLAAKANAEELAAIQDIAVPAASEPVVDEDDSEGNWDELDLDSNEGGDKPVELTEEDLAAVPNEDLGKVEPVKEAPAEEVPAEAAETEEVVPVEEEPVIVEEEEVPLVTKSTEELVKERQEMRTKALVDLQEHFKLSEEDEMLLMRDPNKVLPKLAANMYMDLFDSMVTALQTQLPVMVAAINKQEAVRNKGTQEFYGKWPELNKAEYRKVVDKIADNYRQLNPTATRDKLINEVGAQAWIALQLPLETLVARTQGKAAAAPAKPAAPVSSPRMPAGPGNASTTNRPAAPAPALNEFEIFSEQLLDND